MKLIDADALKIAIDNAWKPDMMVSEIWAIIDEMPTVEVRAELDAYSDDELKWCGFQQDT